MRLARWYAGWTIIAVAIVFQAVSLGTIYYGFTFWITAWMREFHASRAEIMAAMTGLTIVSGLLVPFVGRALDRRSIRALVCTGAILQASAFVLIGLSTALWQIVLIYTTLLAGGLALVGPLAGQTLATKWFAARRGLAIGLVVTGIPVGGLLLPPVITELFATFGWRTTHFILGGLALVAIALPVWLLVRNTPRDAQVAPEPGDLRTEIVTHDAAWSTRRILSQRLFWVLGVSLLTLNTIVAAVLQNLGPRAEDLGIPVRQAAYLVSTYAAALMFANVLFGKLADRWDSRYLYWIAAALLALSLLLMLGNPGYWLLLLACVPLGLAEGCILPVMGMVVSRHFGARAFGRVAGLLLFLITGSAMLGAMLMGWIRDRSGSYDMALVLALLIIIPVALIMVWLPKAQMPCRSGGQAPIAT